MGMIIKGEHEGFVIIELIYHDCGSSMNMHM